jgi:hypothetical protein
LLVFILKEVCCLSKAIAVLSLEVETGEIALFLSIDETIVTSTSYCSEMVLSGSVSPELESLSTGSTFFLESKI